MKKYIIGISILAVALVLFNHKVIAQSFQPLYATSIQFEKAGTGSILLAVGPTLRSGLQTVTIPDGTGNIYTSYNNSNALLVALKAIDVAHASHSGINWTSLGV